MSLKSHVAGVPQYVCNPQNPGNTVRAMESLRDRRERVGLTQAELAERCGCHETTISQIERGRMQPSLELFRRMVPALKVSAKKLLTMLNNVPKATAKAVPTASVTDFQREKEQRLRRRGTAN